MIRRLNVRWLFLALFCGPILLSCSGNSTVRQQEKLQKVSKKETKKVDKKVNAEVPSTISIYRYDGFPIQKAKTLERNLKLYFPNVVLNEKSIPLPIDEYNKAINRYRADKSFRNTLSDNVASLKVLIRF